MAKVAPRFGTAKQSKNLERSSIIYLLLSVLFYVYYTGEAVGDCKLHEFFISFNMILCITLSVISILPKVQEHLPMSGLLQSSCITLYVLYLTWSAMANSPDAKCKPDFSGSNSTDTSKSDEDGSSPDPSHPVRSFDTQSIIGLVVFILCVLYSSVKTSSSSQAAKLTGSDAILLKDKGDFRFRLRLSSNRRFHDFFSNFCL